jgi:hypothetical protein
LTTLATSTEAALISKWSVDNLCYKIYIKYKIANIIKNYEYKIHITKQIKSNGTIVK